MAPHSKAARNHKHKERLCVYEDTRARPAGSSRHSSPAMRQLSLAFHYGASLNVLLFRLSSSKISHTAPIESGATLRVAQSRGSSGRARERRPPPTCPFPFVALLLNEALWCRAGETGRLSLPVLSVMQLEFHKTPVLRSMNMITWRPNVPVCHRQKLFGDH